MKVGSMILLAMFSLGAIADTIEEGLTQLEATLGSYPPAIESDAHKNEITQEYEQLKQQLDALLLKNPGDQTRLHQRGQLQSFGHNMDYPDAWVGAEADLKAVLTQNPSNVRAILDLANLYVNTAPNLAPNAEYLYRAAQCFLDPEPEEETQRGLFFAFYYQGKVEQAYQQSQLLNHLWPESGYGKLVEMTGAVLKRSNKELPTYSADKTTHASCENSQSNT